MNEELSEGTARSGRRQSGSRAREGVCCSARIALLPLADASAVLDDQSRVCNWLYNHLLEQANALREQFVETQDPEVGKRLYSKTGLRDRVPELKKQFPHLTRVHSSPTKNTAHQKYCP